MARNREDVNKGDMLQVSEEYIQKVGFFFS